VSDAGDHLAEFGEFFGLQQLGLKNALRGQVAVDLHVPQKCAFLSRIGRAARSSKRGTGRTR